MWYRPRCILVKSVIGVIVVVIIGSPDGRRSTGRTSIELALSWFCTLPVQLRVARRPGSVGGVVPSVRRCRQTVLYCDWTLRRVRVAFWNRSFLTTYRIRRRYGLASRPKFWPRPRNTGHGLKNLASLSSPAELSPRWRIKQLNCCNSLHRTIRKRRTITVFNPLLIGTKSQQLLMTLTEQWRLVYTGPGWWPVSFGTMSSDLDECRGTSSVPSSLHEIVRWRREGKKGEFDLGGTWQRGGGGIWDSTFQVGWTGSIAPTAAVPNMAARTADNRHGFPAFSWASVAESTATALQRRDKEPDYQSNVVRARTVECDRYCTYLEPFVIEAASQYRFNPSLYVWQFIH